MAARSCFEAMMSSKAEETADAEDRYPLRRFRQIHDNGRSCEGSFSGFADPSGRLCLGQPAFLLVGLGEPETERPINIDSRGQHHFRTGAEGQLDGHLLRGVESSTPPAWGECCLGDNGDIGHAALRSSPEGDGGDERYVGEDPDGSFWGLFGEVAPPLWDEPCIDEDGGAAPTGT